LGSFVAGAGDENERLRATEVRKVPNEVPNGPRLGGAPRCTAIDDAASWALAADSGDISLIEQRDELGRRVTGEQAGRGDIELLRGTSCNARDVGREWIA
jgi:hypothetical protein